MTGNKNRGATVTEPHFCIHIYMKDTENDKFSVHLQDASVFSGSGSSVSLVRRWRRVQQTSIEKKVFTVVLVMQICHKTKTGKWVLFLHQLGQKTQLDCSPQSLDFHFPALEGQLPPAPKASPSDPKEIRGSSRWKTILEGLDKYWKGSVSSFFLCVSRCKVLCFPPGELVLVFLSPFLVLRRKQKWA